MGIAFDDKLTFKIHLKNIRKKANLKLNALARITNSHHLLNNKNFGLLIHKTSIFILRFNLDIFI